MNGINLLLDTNIIIYYFQGNSLAYELIKNNNIFISVVNEMELLSYPSLSDTDSEKIANLLSLFKILPLSENVKNRAIDLRKKHKLKLPDAIIAATAISFDLTLVSADKEILSLNELKGVEFL